jgi:hypothetical protein
MAMNATNKVKLTYFFKSLYYMSKTFVRNNVIIVAICIYIFIFGIIQLIKPGFLYKQDGSIRQFGIGYKNKTIIPIWLLSIILGILSYLSVLYYLL